MSDVSPLELVVASLVEKVDPSVLGARVRAARKASHKTMAEVAEGTFTAAYLSRIENGQRRPSLQVLEHIAERVGVTVSGLLYGLAGSPAAATASHVAVAAARWLRDPTDVQAYGDLVSAVESWEFGLAGPLDPLSAEAGDREPTHVSPRNT